MSKWIDDLNNSYINRVKKRFKKLNEELKEYKWNYKDFPYESTRKAIERRENEIEELVKLAYPKDTKREIDDLNDAIKYYTTMLGKINYLAYQIDPSDEKSLGNIKKLKAMTNLFGCYDEIFKQHANKGIW